MERQFMRRWNGEEIEWRGEGMERRIKRTSKEE
jgi:hypothetical protein